MLRDLDNILLYFTEVVWGFVFLLVKVNHFQGDIFVRFDRFYKLKGSCFDNGALVFDVFDFLEEFLWFSGEQFVDTVMKFDQNIHNLG